MVKLEEGKRRENLRRGLVLTEGHFLRCFPKTKEVPQCHGASWVSGWPGIGLRGICSIGHDYDRERRVSSALRSWFSSPCFVVTNHVGPWPWLCSDSGSHGTAWVTVTEHFLSVCPMDGSRAPSFYPWEGSWIHELGFWGLLSELMEIKHHTTIPSASPAKSSFLYLRCINPLL